MQIRNKPWWDIWAVVLLLLTLWIVALRLELTGWTLHLNRVQLLVTFGYVLGILLGVSTLDRRVVLWVGAAYSLFFVPWQLAASIPDHSDWALRVMTAWERSVTSLNLFLRNQPATDTTLFLLVMSALFWFLGLTSGYMLTRHANPWVPLVLAGLTLFVIDFNDPTRMGQNRFTGFFVLFCVLLLGRLYYLRSQRQWNEKGVAVEFEAGFTINRSMVLGGLMVVFAAWNIPTVFSALTPGTPANAAFTERWHQFRERASNAFAGLESNVVYIYDNYQESMELGTGTGLGEQILFTAKPSVRPSRFNFYWRGYSYDFYNGRDWSNTIEGGGMIQPQDWPLASAEYDARRQVEVEITMRNVGMRPAYVPSMVEALDIPARYVADATGDGMVDLVGVVAEPAIQPRGAFNAVSEVATPTVNDLREAGREYPDWTDRYLQLPEDLPESIRRLALDIVGEETNPYYQAQWITEFLRQEMEYQEVIEEPPADQDPIEWFLFDYKKGFCNYYATAAILMLRSLDVPARIAVGFAEGVYNEDEGYFEVREKDSHAWPEVYFPGIGWVEFEPTAAIPEQNWVEIFPEDEQDSAFTGPMFPDNRPLLDFEAYDERMEAREGEGSGEAFVLPPEPVNRTWLWIITALGVLAATTWLIARRFPSLFAEPLPLKIERGFHSFGFKPPSLIQLWARQMELHPIQRMFTHVPWMLRLLGVRSASGTTPNELVNQLINGIPDAGEPASTLLDQYQLAVYSPHPYDLARARQAYLKLWRLVTRNATRRLVKWLPV